MPSLESLIFLKFLLNSLIDSADSVIIDQFADKVVHLSSDNRDEVKIAQFTISLCLRKPVSQLKRYILIVMVVHTE
jgi:hypothetical protein